jgi:iron complex outermembrane receptor protein
MRRIAFLRSAVGVVAACIASAALAQQETFKDYKDVQLSDLLQMDVTTASKIGQPLLETPVAITVIDRDQIASYAVQSVPELLRDVVGVNVVMYDSGDYVVGMRGNYSPPTNNILVLLDGKNVYQNVYGFVLWNALPISTDEIERIEIIRGPASSLYGANAAMGVINIITRTDDEQGLRLAAGTPGVRHATLQLAHSGDHYRFRTGLTYRAIDSFDRTPHETAAVIRPSGRPAYRVPALDVSLAFKFSGNRSLTFFAGGTEFDDELQLGLLGYARLKSNFFGQFSTTYQGPAATVHAYVNRTELHGPLRLLSGLFGAAPSMTRIDETVATLDYSQALTHSLGKATGRLLWGGDVQGNDMSSTLIDQRRSQLLLATFVQEEYRPVSNLIVMAGARFDKHPVTHAHVSPRGSLTYVLNGKHSFRVSYGEAYRNPTLVETYGKVSLLDLPGTFFAANNKLRAEQVRNVEAGYRGSFGSRLSLGLTAYAYSVDNIIGPARPFVPLPIHAINDPARLRSHGIEAESDTIVSRFLRLRMNYRWLKYDPALADGATNLADNVYKHVTNTQWDFRWKRAQIDFRTNWYVDRIDTHPVPIEASNLFLAHLHAGYTTAIRGHDVMPYVNIFNLTNQHKAEIVDGPSNIALRRSIAAGLRVLF